MKESKGEFLSDDVIAWHILHHRLPAKALSRLKCVCRRWNHLISNDPNFICLQSQNSSTSSSLLFMSKGKMEFITRDQRSVGIPKISLPIEWHSLEIIASCNGLLCIKALSGLQWFVFVGNPVLNDWRPIYNPSSSVINYIDDDISYGFAVDLRNSSVCYKLVIPHEHKADDTDSMEYSFEVFSSETGTWKLSKETIIKFNDIDNDIWSPQDATYVSGTLYWKCRYNLLWFDPIQERGGLLSLPSELKSISPWGIGEWNGMLTYTRIAHSAIEIWSLDRSHCHLSYSIKLAKILEDNLETFTSLCCKMHLSSSTDLLYLFGGLCRVFPRPFEGYVLFFEIDRTMFWYEIETGVVSKHELPNSSFPYSGWFSYRNCLISSPILRPAGMCVRDL